MCGVEFAGPPPVNGGMSRLPIIATCLLLALAASLPAAEPRIEPGVGIGGVNLGTAQVEAEVVAEKALAGPDDFQGYDSRLMVGSVKTCSLGRFR